MISHIFSTIGLSFLVLSLQQQPASAFPTFTRSDEASTTAEECRCFPGDFCWPKQSDWDALNTTVGGRLVATHPLASPCHESTFGAYDEATCEALREEWSDPMLHIKSTHSIMAPFFANQSCDPFLPKDSQCVVGAYVQYTVNARTAEDFQATINFTNHHNIRLVIRNTGHDWLGKSSGPGALALRTYDLKTTEILDYDSSYYTGKALKVGAGVSLGEAYQATHDQGLVNVGGTCPTVGLAGYTQGAGHGLTVSEFGLGADQTLQWEVITVDGQILNATPEEHSDLYWALSGGGGGTYAAVLSFTIKVYEDQITSAASLTWTNEGISQDTFYAGLQAFFDSLPSLVETGVSGNWLNTNTSFSMAPFVSVGMNKATMDELYEPLLQELQQLDINYTYNSGEYSTFLDMYTAVNPMTEVGVFQIGSRLIPKDVVTDASDDLASSIRFINEHEGAYISGLAFDASNPPNIPNSVNPAWRDASISLVVGLLFDHVNWSKNIENQRLMTNTLIPELSKLMPGREAAYLSEGDPWEPNWQSVFYGESYDRLLEIKKKYDPESTFYARTAVGSESWTEQEDGRLCRT